jgi:hypothetical protein
MAKRAAGSYREAASLMLTQQRISHKPGPQSERHALDSLPVRTRGDRHSGRMEGTGLSAGPAPAEPPCIIGGGATGGSPRPSVRSVNLVSLSRSHAYRHLPSMAREADVIPTGAVLDRSLTLNPNGATGWIFRGWFHAFRKSAPHGIDVPSRKLRLGRKRGRSRPPR